MQLSIILFLDSSDLALDGAICGGLLYYLDERECSWTALKAFYYLARDVKAKAMVKAVAIKRDADSSIMPDENLVLASHFEIGFTHLDIQFAADGLAACASKSSYSTYISRNLDAASLAPDSK
jgi:hypothetical protein